MSAHAVDFLVLPSHAIRNLTFGRAAFALFTFVVVRFISNAIYRLYFHPLKDFPGPRLNAMTQIPNVFNIYTGNHVNMVCRLHEKYGHVVRISPNELSFNDARAWKDVHGHQKLGQPNITKHPEWYVPAINDVHSIISHPDPVEHARMRRIFSNAFSDRALKQQEALFAKYADLLCKTLKRFVDEDPNGHAIDIVRMYNFTTFDIMSDLTFGEPLSLLNNADYIPWVANIFRSIRTGSKIGIVRYWPSLYAALKKLTGNTFQKNRVIHFDYSARRVDSRLERGSDQPDIWNLVLNAKEGRGLSRGEMYASATVFMIAGTETTATLLSGVTYFLLKNPEYYKKLTEEVRSAFKKPSDVTIEALQQLTYLRACLEEALRMYPPVPVGLPHIVPNGGAEVCGDWIPGGTTVSVHQLAMYQDPKNFKNPKTYVPDRWLGDEEYENDNRAALQPFAYGPRNCLGKNLAYHEMRIILAFVLINFDLEMLPECDNWTEQEVYTLWQKHPLKLKLRPRAI